MLHLQYDKETHNISATLNTSDLCGSDTITLVYDHETNSMVKANYVDPNTSLNSTVYYSNIINEDITNYYFSDYRSEYKIFNWWVGAVNDQGFFKVEGFEGRGGE